jgi:hypothetical protein
MGDRQQRAKQDKHTHTLSILSKKADRVKELGTRDNSSCQKNLKKKVRKKFLSVRTVRITSFFIIHYLKVFKNRR